MPIQTIAILLSLLALVVSIGSFLSSRQAAWSIRYYERWFQLARIVLDLADALLPLWCDAVQYQQMFGKEFPPDREPHPEELVFAEMYVDFLLEVHRRGPVVAFLTGRFPGRVPLTNPRTLRIWDKHVRLLYSERDQKIVDRVIAQGK
jgi:hypothetical protein